MYMKQRHRLRRAMLYIPGNNPRMMRDAHIYMADSIMFDLEDSVSVNEKDSARFLVYNALTTIDYGAVETVVRVNPISSAFGRDDFEAIVRANPDVIRLPKTETADDIREADALIGEIEKKAGLEPRSIRMMAAVESALGVLNAKEIATASDRLVGIALGAEDYVTDLKTRRYADGMELLFARSMVLNAARAAGISALDTVFSDVNDEEGFRNEVRLIKQLGFDGKSVINPRQIEPLIEIYTPTAAEIEHAYNVIEAINEAERNRSGVISLNGKMIDKPIVERAKHILMLAGASSTV